MECFRWAKRRLRKPTSGGAHKHKTSTRAPHITLDTTLPHHESYHFVDPHLPQKDFVEIKQLTPSTSSSNLQLSDTHSTTMPQSTGLGQKVVSHWETILRISQAPACSLRVDGNSLNLAGIVACARYGADVRIDQDVATSMDGSLDCLKAALDEGREVYGVNTGFGGSANTHTDNVERLQRNLIGFLNCGVTNSSTATDTFLYPGMDDCQVDRTFAAALIDGESSALIMPESWVRSSMLIRCNSLASGNSGVRPELLEGIVFLLRNNIIPVLPLRGSISASGDLIPLSFIAGALQGSPNVQVRISDKTGKRTQVSADIALKSMGHHCLKLGPKEGLAIVNGTAVSAGVGALALHDAQNLAMLSQILTAMGVEALAGCKESFHPFFSKSRPHPGQAEVARNIRSFLRNSRLVTDSEEEITDEDSLRQDRYSVRTTPQWLGPTIEDYLLADKQMGVEVNSTTDNPLIDAENNKILHGGNFQAMSVTSAMEKVRKGSQVIGRMLFAQCTELINPSLNNGLPPNLTADEPSQDYLLKGVDIMVASLLSELGFLASPVGPHVQNAEMHNQSLNSLALLSARYTHTALDVLSQLAAAYVLTLCQALDLRTLNARFLAKMEAKIQDSIFEAFSSHLSNIAQLQAKICSAFTGQFRKTAGMDSGNRFIHIITHLQPTILAHYMANPSGNTTKSQNESSFITALTRWTSTITSIAREVYHRTRVEYMAEPGATSVLGAASKRMYIYVRRDLGVPFMASAIREPGTVDGQKAGVQEKTGVSTGTIGDQIGKISGAIKRGGVLGVIVECLREAEAEGERKG